MRTTFVTVNRNVQNQLSRRYGDMVSLQEQLATGRRLRKPSDDPIDVANAIKLRTKKTQLSQYKRNIEDGMAVMGVASSAMSSMNELLHRARELAVQGANGTYTDNDRIYMQKEVDQIFRQMMSVINTQFKGNYVFNGTNTKTPPYVIARSSSNLTDYNNRTMATYGHELEISMQNAAEHHTADDTIYLNYSLSQLRIGDTVQLTWDSATNTDLHGNALTNIIQESFPLDTYAVTTASGETEIFRKDLDYAVDYRTGKITILSEGFRDRLNNTPPADRVANTGIGFNAYGSGGVDEDGNPILDADGNPIVDEDGNPIITPILQYSLINTFQLIGGKFGEDITQIFPGSFNLKIGDREYVEGFGEYKGGYYDEEGVYHKGENEFDYSIDYETGKITIYNMDLLRDMRPEWLQDPTNPHHRDPENMYRPGQLQIDFDYITRGTDIYGERVSSQGEILRAIEEGIAAPINMRAD
jgi:flagellin-like hook-associated protein FlgL